MNANILNYYAKTNTGFLHSFGEEATEKLVRELGAKNGEAILEIGCGTGATLVKLKARNDNLRLSGLERSSLMYEKSRKRLKFTGLLHKIPLDLLKTADRFPYETNSVDKIFAESVLAFQSNEVLMGIISEINRILKPEGLLVLNETLWLPSIPQGEIEKLNHHCLHNFGIIQCNETYKYPEDWKTLLSRCDFEILRVSPVKDLSSARVRPFNLPELRSRIFSVCGKIKASVNPSLRKELKFYKDKMNSMFKDKQYLEGMMIIARNAKQE